MAADLNYVSIQERRRLLVTQEGLQKRSVWAGESVERTLFVPQIWILWMSSEKKDKYFLKFFTSHVSHMKHVNVDWVRLE